MKKLFVFILILALCLGLCGCGKGKQKELYLGLAYSISTDNCVQSEDGCIVDAYLTVVGVLAYNSESIYKSAADVVPAKVAFDKNGEIVYCDAYSKNEAHTITKSDTAEIDRLLTEALNNALYVGYMDGNDLSIKVLSTFDMCSDESPNKAGRAEIDFNLCLKACSEDNLNGLVLKNINLCSEINDGILAGIVISEKNKSELEYLRDYCTGMSLKDISEIPVDSRTGLPGDSVMARNCNINHFAEILDLISYEEEYFNY